jgi:hypothetical protein
MAVSRRTLIERIDRFLRTMEKARREPDQWEGQCMLAALADIARDDMAHAEQMMNLAKTMPEQRTSERPEEAASRYQHPRLAELRTQLENLRLDQLAA